VPVGLKGLYNHPEASLDPIFMGEVGEVHIYQFMQH